MTYAVVYRNSLTGETEAVLARGLDFMHADEMAARMFDRARDGMYFKAVNENELAVEGD
jgi:hypothetical protein